MKKNIYIENLKIGDSIFSESFALKSFVKKASRNNKPYIDVELSDKTGTVKGKIWADNFSSCEETKEGDVVEINATVDDYHGPQLNITNLRVAKNYNTDDYQQKSKFDIDTMWEDVKKTIESTKNPHIKNLLKNVFTDDIIKKFKNSTAAYKVHHAYIGGLLEHTWEMLKMAEGLRVHYPKINMDIINAGIILHDIGKIFEYEMSTIIDISDQGKMLGHIFIGADLVKKSAPQEMPIDLLNEVLHIVLSHHGEKEFGSPIVPMTTEALVVSTLDAASSKINIAYLNIHSSLGNEKYTPFISHLKTELYRSKYLEEEAPF